ncbi:MAG: hypothetical protein AB1689_26180, partial [Thermodesulfobacteriota bacterium]
RPRAGRAAVVAALALALAASASGCERESRTVLTGHTVRARDLEKVAIGRSTTADVERVFGPPDERSPDGSLVYRATAVRRSIRTVAGVPVGGSEEVVGWRTAKFQFANGVLKKVCRERS